MMITFLPRVSLLVLLSLTMIVTRYDSNNIIARHKKHTAYQLLYCYIHSTVLYVIRYTVQRTQKYYLYRQLLEPFTMNTRIAFIVCSVCTCAIVLNTPYNSLQYALNTVYIICTCTTNRCRYLYDVYRQTSLLRGEGNAVQIGLCSVIQYHHLSVNLSG